MEALEHSGDRVCMEGEKRTDTLGEKAARARALSDWERQSVDMDSEGVSLRKLAAIQSFLQSQHDHQPLEATMRSNNDDNCRDTQPDFVCERDVWSQEYYNDCEGNEEEEEIEAAERDMSQGECLGALDLLLLSRIEEILDEMTMNIDPNKNDHPEEFNQEGYHDDGNPTDIQRQWQKTQGEVLHDLETRTELISKIINARTDEYKEQSNSVIEEMERY